MNVEDLVTTTPEAGVTAEFDGTTPSGDPYGSGSQNTVKMNDSAEAGVYVDCAVTSI
jgi:hypothetical protein